MNSLVPLIITVVLFAFWIWMFWDMANNEDLPNNDRLLWTAGFVFLSLLAAGYYYLSEYKYRKK